MAQELTIKTLDAAHSQAALGAPPSSDVASFDAPFEILYWIQHPLNGNPSWTDDIHSWWTCFDFGAALINTYAQYGYNAAVAHLKRAKLRTFDPIELRLQYRQEWKQMASLIDDYNSNKLKDRLERGMKILKILTENTAVVPESVYTIRNVAPGTILAEGLVLNDWQCRFVSVSRGSPPRVQPRQLEHEVNGHVFLISWPKTCKQITAWELNGTDWVLPQGYTFKLTKCLENQRWEAIAIPPKNDAPAKPMQATVKPTTELPEETEGKIIQLVIEDLIRHFNEDHGYTTMGNVVDAFVQAKQVMSSPKFDQFWVKDFDYYPNITEFFDLTMFVNKTLDELSKLDVRK